MKTLIFIFFILALSVPAQAKDMSVAALDAGKKPLKVRGQSRSLRLMNIQKNQMQDIEFVKPRKSYRDEITHTKF